MAQDPTGPIQCHLTTTQSDQPQTRVQRNCICLSSRSDCPRSIAASVPCSAQQLPQYKLLQTACMYIADRRLYKRTSPSCGQPADPTTNRHQTRHKLSCTPVYWAHPEQLLPRGPLAQHGAAAPACAQRSMVCHLCAAGSSRVCCAQRNHPALYKRCSPPKAGTAQFMKVPSTCLLPLQQPAATNPCNAVLMYAKIGDRRFPAATI